MFEIGDKVVVSVKEDSVLLDFNKEEGVIIDIVKDLLGHRLYGVDISGNKILAFDFELKANNKIKKNNKGEKKCE